MWEDGGGGEGYLIDPGLMREASAKKAQGRKTARHNRGAKNEGLKEDSAITLLRYEYTHCYFHIPFPCCNTKDRVFPPALVVNWRLRVHPREK